MTDSPLVEDDSFALSEFRPKRLCRRYLESRIGGWEGDSDQACAFAHSVSELHLGALELEVQLASLLNM